MDMRPHPKLWLTIGLVIPAGILAAANTALKVVAVTAAVVFGVGVPALMIVATVGHIVVFIPAITITAIPMPVDHALRTTRLTPQGLVVMEVQPPVPI